jgi:quercetin dioxygenase-like cupin family protein
MIHKQGQVRLNPAQETIQVGLVQIHFLVTGAESKGSVAIFEVGIPAGAKLPAPPHSHDAFEETIYGLVGFSIWTVDGVPIEIGPEQTLCIPRGAVHAFANQSSTVDAKVLAIASPAAIGPEFFREVAAVMNAAAGGPPDRAKMVEVLRRHGLTPASLPSM